MQEKTDVYSTPEVDYDYYYSYRARRYVAVPYWRDRTDVYKYTEGTLNVDLVDAKQNRLVWTGVAVGRVGRTKPEERGAKIDAAIAAGRGLVLLTPHLGSFEVSARAVVERWGAQLPLTVLYRPARQAFLRELEETARHRPGLATAPANLSGVRQMLRALKKGEMVGLLPDQVPPEGQGVWAPFFGQPAYTMTLAARLVQQTGAAVLVLCCERLPGGAGFEVHLLDLEADLPVGSDEAAQVQAATVVNRTMEMVIRRWPHQYLWGYHRYKQPRRVAAAQA
ncbi:MAG: DUF4136 domain-containing protein [Burkholderiales bacterium]|nr:DUF4136 domain-containing protein [Burkholderiales bacterium]